MNEMAFNNTSRNRNVLSLFVIAFLALVTLEQATAAGDPKRGAIVFRNCVACHSVEPGRHMTGPSLANVFGKKAGTVEGFRRYSDALRHAGVVWNEQTLDRWLKNPSEYIPRNDMAFPGIRERQMREDLIAFLRAVSEDKAPLAEIQGGGMMMGGRMPNLKKAAVSEQVKSIRHCGDTYFIATMTGEDIKIWEFNLRFKTDSSDDGPLPGKPVLIGAGMRGDRASIIFSVPDEISAFIMESCQ